MGRMAHRGPERGGGLTDTGAATVPRRAAGPPVAPADVTALAGRVRQVRAAAPDPTRRTMIGITGPPGAGKSTLAAALTEELRTGPPVTHVAVVGMDGFHLAGRVLAAAGTAEIKGAPQTFDPWGFLAVLARLRAVPREPVYAPAFDRSLEEPIAGAVPIGPTVDVVVVEGNYLLLDLPPWNRVASLLDEAWYLDVPESVRVERLVARHVRFGRTERQARQRATDGPDGANAVVIAQGRHHADLVITDSAGGSDACRAVPPGRQAKRPPANPLPTRREPPRTV